MTLKNFYTKVRNRLWRSLIHYIPHNQSLKPSGFSQSSEEYFKSKGIKDYKCVKIYSGYSYHLDLPEDLLNAAGKFKKPVSEMQLPDLLVVEVPNGRLYTDQYSTIAIMTSDKILLNDISMELRDKKIIYPFINKIFKVKYFTKPAKYTGKVFTMLTGGGGLNNYFHWFFDVLPRLSLLRKSGLYDQIDWFLIPVCQSSFQRDSLRMLGIDKSKLIESTVVQHLQADSIVASSAHRNAGQMEKWVCDFLKESFVSKNIDTPKKYPKFIYITRSDSKSRNVINEAELTSILDDYGFKTVSLSGLSFIEQVELFANVEIIVSPHGAGLANLVFCKEGTKVVEFFSEGWVVPVYYDLAKKTNLDYYYQISAVSPAPQNADEAQHKHFEADIPAIMSIIEKFDDLKKMSLVN